RWPARGRRAGRGTRASGVRESEAKVSAARTRSGGGRTNPHDLRPGCRVCVTHAARIGPLTGRTVTLRTRVRASFVRAVEIVVGHPIASEARAVGLDDAG